ncbi:MAG: alpha-amylase family glycosyl hydrolase, partial [Hungatella sp.]
TCAEGYSFDPALYANNNPGLLDFLNELKTEVLSQYDVMTVGETVEVTPEIAIQYVNEENGPINMVFHFQITNLKEKFTWQKFKKVQRAWIHTFSEQNGWNSQYLQNHDQPRCVSIYGDAENFRVVSAKMLATMLHTLPGTPYVYQGEEIGMTNTDFPSIDLFDDINAKFSYNELLLSGKSKEAALEELNRYSRDHARTPMQWSNEKGAGFTTGTPWLMINPNYKEINVEEAEKDPNSIFHYYQQLIQLRKEHKVFVYGDFTEYFQDSDSVYIYTRSFEEETIGVLLNLTGKEQEIVVPFAMGKKIIIGNYLHHKEGSTVTLHPYEAIVCL